jgi:hypothetical protein
MRDAHLMLLPPSIVTARGSPGDLQAGASVVFTASEHTSRDAAAHTCEVVVTAGEAVAAGSDPELPETSARCDKK